MTKPTLKMLQSLHYKIFKVYLVISEAATGGVLSKRCPWKFHKIDKKKRDSGTGVFL